MARRALQALLLLVAIVVGATGNAPRAWAQVTLVDSPGEDPAPNRGEKVTPAAATTLETPVKAAPTSTTVTAPSSDTITGVVNARVETKALLDQRFAAMESVREAGLHGTPEELAAAQKHLADVKQQIEQSRAQISNALDANELSTQAAVLAEQKRVYGPNGPSTLDTAKTALSTTGGVLVGTTEGTVKGVGDILTGLGHAIAHPIDTTTSIYDALTRPAPTAAERSAADIQLLQKQRDDRIAAVDSPFQTARNGGEVLGRYGIAPLLGGEVVGATAGALGRTVETIAPVASRPLATSGDAVATSAANAERLKSSLAAQEIVNAERSGNALIKDDPQHRAASFLTQEQLAAGRVFPLKGGDGVQRSLLQTQGEFNGRGGIYEYILEPSGAVSHQRFIEGGQITGFPNQIPSRLVK